MKKHICKQCNKVYEYCRGCLLSPISYKENGFCSETCQDIYRKQIEEVVLSKDVEVVVIKEEDTSTPTEEAIEYPYFFTATETEEIEEKEENEEDDHIEDNGEIIRTE